MNVAAVAKSEMQWMLPLDLRRLRLMRTTVEHEGQFAEIWRRIDEALVSPVEGRGRFWFCASPVGAAIPGHGQWVEYWKARPWLEVARLARDLVLVAPCTASWIAGRGSRLQCGVRGTEILPTAHEKLQAVDQRIELAHVAALDPLGEGWEPTGYVEAAALSRVRRAMQDWPQRATNGRVVMEG